MSSHYNVTYAGQVRSESDCFVYEKGHRVNVISWKFDIQSVGISFKKIFEDSAKNCRSDKTKVFRSENKKESERQFFAKSLLFSLWLTLSHNSIS